MTWARARAGLVGGAAGIAPLAAIALLSALGALASDLAAPLALGALPLGVVLAGAITGYGAGQARRRRSEVKAVIGGIAGVLAALVFGGALEITYAVRYLQTPVYLRAGSLSVHPLRVSAAILLLSALIVAVAMITAHFTARPLPPPRPGRRPTSAMPASPPPTQRQPPLPRR